MKREVFDLNNYNKMKRVDIHQYTHIRAYHACRPLDVHEYLTHGIVPYTKDKAKREAILRLGKAISEKKIAEKFDEIWYESKEKVWLACNKRTLIEESGHYLIYGSEFLNVLAMELGYREILKLTGFPTIFSCDIPITDLSKSVAKELENYINEGEVDDASICVTQVDPEKIISYEHPKRVMDPYLGGYYSPDCLWLKELE